MELIVQLCDANELALLIMFLFISSCLSLENYSCVTCCDVGTSDT